MMWKPAHLVVGGWAAFHLVLALIIFAFGPKGPLEAWIAIPSVVLVAGFGLAVLLALRAGRAGVQQRQPRGARAAVFTALGLAVGLTGFVYGWWMGLLGVYPLGLAVWLWRGERLGSGAQPFPVALDGAEPTSPPRFVHHGSSIGVATAVPPEHAVHGPPRPPPPPPPPLSPPWRWLRGAILVVAGGRAAVNLLRARRK